MEVISSFFSQEAGGCDSVCLCVGGGVGVAVELSLTHIYALTQSKFISVRMIFPPFGKTPFVLFSIAFASREIVKGRGQGHRGEMRFWGMMIYTQSFKASFSNSLYTYAFSEKLITQ